MNLGIVNEESWAFFKDVYEDLSDHHHTQIFGRRTTKSPLFNNRLERHLLAHDLQSFMQQNQVVFFEWASDLLSVASHLPKTCGIVTRLHRYEMYQWSDRINWNAVDKIILVSYEKKREFEKEYPEHGAKVVVIPVSVSLTRFQPILKKFQGNIGILCHLSPRKRVYDLILTFYELIQKKPGLHLFIGGGMRPAFKDYYSALLRLVSKLNLQDCVSFDGHVEHPETWYSKIDIFVSNSYSEGLQVSPMEAMASGCYTLSHRWAGAEELLPEEYLYYSNSELKEKIIKYCDFPEIERLHQQKIQLDLIHEKFNLDITKQQIRDLIEEVAEIAQPDKK